MTPLTLVAACWQISRPATMLLAGHVTHSFNWPVPLSNRLSSVTGADSNCIAAWRNATDHSPPEIKTPGGCRGNHRDSYSVKAEREFRSLAFHRSGCAGRP